MFWTDQFNNPNNRLGYHPMARQLARREGIFGGITSGGNVWAALERARQLGPGHRVVTVIVDSGLKYLRGDLYE